MSDHEWCRDTARDEAVRAAEDAANWRRLEVGEVVQAGDEHRNCWGWKPVPTAWYGQVLGDGFWPLRRRIPSAPQHRDLPEVVAALTERVAKIEEAMMSGSTWYPICDIPSPPPPPAPPQPAPVPPAEGLRTERVTLEVTQRTESYAPLSEFDWTAMLRSACRGRLFDGESVRVVEAATIGTGDVFRDVGCGSTADEIARLTAERDAARRERYEAREECERLSEWVPLRASMEVARLKARVAELEAAPPPRGWLTAEEREAVDAAADAIGDRIDAYKEQDGDRRRIEVLDGLLARSTPPRVKVPAWLHAGVRGVVADAIREAGGEVE